MMGFCPVEPLQAALLRQRCIGRHPSWRMACKGRRSSMTGRQSGAEFRGKRGKSKGRIYQGEEDGIYHMNT